MSEIFYELYEPLLKLENRDAVLVFCTYVFIVVMGLSVGSFLNVCIFRMPINESIIGKLGKKNKPSHCFSCGAKIMPKDNIPLFSWIFLKGRCRACGSKISFRYPLVEALNLVVWLITFNVMDVSPKSILYCAFFSVLIVIGFIDWDTFEIPVILLVDIFILAVIASLIAVTFSWEGGTLHYTYDVSLKSRLIGGVAVSVPFFIIGEISGKFVKSMREKENNVEITEKIRGIELGDTILMFVAGLFIGVKAIVFSAFIGVLIAAIIGIIYKKVTKESIMAFGPALAFSIFIGALWGDDIVNWWLNNFIYVTYN